jgi:hypothetical protein
MAGPNCRAQAAVPEAGRAQGFSESGLMAQAAVSKETQEEIKI